MRRNNFEHRSGTSETMTFITDAAAPHRKWRPVG
jgi:hypothetical protein